MLHNLEAFVIKYVVITYTIEHVKWLHEISCTNIEFYICWTHVFPVCLEPTNIVLLVQNYYIVYAN
jgi:hypothetical protein